MAIPDPSLPFKNINTLELGKFTIDDNGDIIIRTSTSGILQPKGLTTAMRVTEITIGDSGWTKLERNGTSNPTGSGNLTDTNSVRILNTSTTTEIKVNGVEAIDDSLGYIGYPIPTESEDYYDVRINDVAIYARAESGSATVILQEFA